MKRWMKAAAAVLFSATAANAQIFTWTAAGDKTGNSDMASMVWVNSHGLGDMTSAITKLKARPAGMRCLYLACDNHAIFNEASDQLAGKLKSLWWPKGIAKAAAGEQTLIAQMRSANLVPDYFILDNEDAPCRWNMSPANLLAVANDARGKVLGVSAIVATGDETAGVIFDTITSRVSKAAIAQGIFSPLLTYAPSATMTQYGDLMISASEGQLVRDINNHALLQDSLAGNAQSPAIYGNKGWNSQTNTPYSVTGYSMNLLRVAANHGRVMPWYSGDNVENPVWKGTPYWSESIRHGLLTCGMKGLLFDAGQPTAAQKVSDIYVETKQITGGTLPTTMCSTDLIDTTAQYFVTARADNWDGSTPATRVVGRVTFAPGVTTATFTVAGRSFTAKPATGQAGAWFTYSTSTPVTVPAKGKGSTTAVTTTPTNTTNLQKTGATWFDRTQLNRRVIVPR